MMMKLNFGKRNSIFGKRTVLQTMGSLSSPFDEVLFSVIMDFNLHEVIVVWAPANDRERNWGEIIAFDCHSLGD